ncbi:MAG: copper-binding protein [Alphaproteobacteria bacterium]|nr:copper-binding protein [Alphaproteobacteria bacterium]
MKIIVTLTCAMLGLWSAAAFAEGFLVQRTERLPDIELGLGDAGYGVSQNEYELVTGKGYRLTIKSTGAKPCEFSAEEFFQNVWFRKIEIDKVELRVPTVYEIEFEREGEAELFFTPIKPGDYDWVCEGFEDKGMKGSITVK